LADAFVSKWYLEPVEDRKGRREAALFLLSETGQAVAMSDDQDTIWREIILVNEGVYKIWDMYVTFYTWFFGANLLALSWMFSIAEAPAFTANKGMICGIWVVMNLFTTATTLMLSYHSYRMNKRINDLLASRGSASLVEADDILPLTMTTWGGIANAFSLIINAVLWTVLYQI